MNNFSTLFKSVLLSIFFVSSAAFAQDTRTYFINKSGETVFRSSISEIDSIVFKQVVDEKPIEVLKTPTAADFDIIGVGSFDYDGEVKIVKVISRNGKTSGIVTVKYNGSTIAPSAVGTYSVTFDVTESSGWYAVNGLSAGVLIINPNSTQRYKTYPESYELLIYDYDENVNTYAKVLGTVFSVPLASTAAIYYDGVTPQTITYQRSDVNETSISASVSDAVVHSFSTSQTSSWEVALELGIDKDFFAKFAAKKGGTSGWDQTNSRSITNTLEASRTTASGETFTYSFTIGENNEPKGCYRYALFSTCDVYYVIKTDRNKTRVVDSYIAFCTRPIQSLVIDYDPEFPASFRKTAPGQLLTIPNISLSQLPDIPECQHIWTAWGITFGPTCETEGEEIRFCILDKSHVERRTIPALGHQLIRKITKQPTDTADGEETVSCTRCSYKEPAIPFVIKYLERLTDERSMPGTGGNNVVPWRHTSKFNIESLKFHGYKYFTINVSFRRRAAGVFGSEYQVDLYPGHPINRSGDRWASEKKGLVAEVFGPSWGTHNLSVDVPFDAYNNQFTVFFVGTSLLDWRIGERTVTVVAKK